MYIGRKGRSGLVGRNRATKLSNKEDDMKKVKDLITETKFEESSKVNKIS